MIRQRKLHTLLVAAGSLVVAHQAVATTATTTHTFQPAPRADLWDLDHYYAYKWGLDWLVPEGEQIVGASLSFNNIRNWDPNPNDLYVNLIDTTHVGVQTFYDNMGGGDMFASIGDLLVHYEDLPMTAQDLTYEFTQDALDKLAFYAIDGRFGIGFDPDCHYWNDGITLKIDTAALPPPPPPSVPTDSQAVPEPAAASLVLLGLAAAGYGTIRRRRTR